MTITRDIVCGQRWIEATLPDDAHVLPAGVTLPLEPAPDLEVAVEAAVDRPVDGPPLDARVGPGDTVTIAFDDATVPCWAPLWSTAIPIIVDRLERGGVPNRHIRLVCANSLHRKLRPMELEELLGTDVARTFDGHITCHDAEDKDELVHLGTTRSGYDVELNRCVVESDLTIYLNCSTMRGFSGGWKSICVGLSGYRSIRHHHTPDIMSMSLDRNRMHEMLDEMGEVVDTQLGRDRIFKLETVLANPLAVHEVYGGSVWATRARVIEKLKGHQPSRRTLLDDRVDVVVYGVPDWSPYAAFTHTNPILDLISTGLGYLGGMIQAVGRPGCTVIIATPCPERWDEVAHPSYREVWEEVLPQTRDPDVARDRFEPELATRAEYVDAYRHGYGFHPVHGIMAIYPLKRLRHAGRVIVVGAEDPAVPARCGFDSAVTVGEAIAVAAETHGSDPSVALVENPPAFNRR